MGGVVKAVTKPLAGAFNFVTKATGLGKASDWKEKSSTFKDPNRLAYQWDVVNQHQDSAARGDLSKARGGFTGQTTDYATLARDARAATDATGSQAQKEALNRAKNRRAALQREMEEKRSAIAGMRADARAQLEKDMRDNVVDRIQGETAESRAKRMRERVQKERDMNIFGSRSDIKMPGDPGYGEMQEEEEKFKKPAYREFLERIAAAKKGDFG
tara:strand:+ start:578 stop:1222 length:645 start_codon:yes stop_codon:yes gene_type:complete